MAFHPEEQEHFLSVLGLWGNFQTSRSCQIQVNCFPFPQTLRMILDYSETAEQL